MEIYNDDCFNIFPKITQKVDLVLVDLPYAQTACKWDIPIDLKQMWIELKKICKKGCVFVFFCTTKFGYKLIQSNEKWFRYDIVWEKSRKVGFLSANRMPLRKHEMMYIFKEKQGVYNPQKTEGKPYKTKGNKSTNPEEYLYDDRVKEFYPVENTGDRHPTTIVKFNNPSKSVHKTQKPVDLCEWLINTYSNEGELVLDFTMGSGSTGVACKNTGRRFIGVEKDEDIFKTAQKRCEIDK